MSGGFFRGTTADQDTRFSNKQAKLLKSQKFAPELEHLVDVSKVKMDVIKPWIAKRVTEFLGGFEDEVLINFIYGLLEGKEINGKAVQIQLTGFMEKNTGKFMKELWALLISAQNNASGVPQQFLDAKEEETKKKKAETDRITSEIQKRKDRETEEEKKRKMDGGLGNSSSEESNRRRERGSDSHSGDRNGVDVQNGFRGRNRSPRLPYPSDRSPSPHRGWRSVSVSKSFSNSRSYSKERSISKSVSPRPRKYSVSPETVRRTQKSVSPRKPVARVSTSPKRKLHSGRSPSPTRRRFHSPLRRRSPSPFRRRSRSPLRRRSPPRRRRSPSPRRRQSPSPRRHRSPSPLRQRRRRSTSSPRSRSPVQRRSPYGGGRRYQSPVRRRSPFPGRRVSPSPDRRGSPLPRRRRSPSPRRRRSPSPRRRRSPSPVRRRSPYAIRRRTPVPVRNRSPTRSPSRSVSPANRSSASPARDSSASPIKMKSPKERARLNDRAEPVLVARRQSMAMSPQRDHSNISRSRRKVPSLSPSPEKSPTYMESPKPKTRSSGDNRRFLFFGAWSFSRKMKIAIPFFVVSNVNSNVVLPFFRLDNSYGSAHKTKSAEDKTIRDGSQSPLREMKGQRVRRSSPHKIIEEFQNSRKGEQSEHKSTERGSDLPYSGKKHEPHDKPAGRLRDITDLGQKDTKRTRKGLIDSFEVTPEEANVAKRSPRKDSVSRARDVTSHPTEPTKTAEKISSLSKDTGDTSRPDALVNPRKKRRSPSVSSDSESELSENQKPEVTGKRKHKRSSKREAVSDDSSSESEVEDRKEAKRRKKEERKSRKEERRRRRRRDERRRKREEKRASRRKQKSKDADALSPDLKKHEKADKASNGERVAAKYSSEEETESQKKKLEIELREKALESLRAKKGIRH
ncbi:hypothetical protein KSS87_019255 [Heliosperma pusillum]|nr:hypothetical protein KSS87_019255 [Heliosperma pusillum]